MVRAAYHGSPDAVVAVASAVAMRASTRDDVRAALEDALSTVVLVRYQEARYVQTIVRLLRHVGPFTAHTLAHPLSIALQSYYNGQYLVDVVFAELRDEPLLRDAVLHAVATLRTWVAVKNAVQLIDLAAGRDDARFALMVALKRAFYTTSEIHGTALYRDPRIAQAERGALVLQIAKDAAASNNVFALKNALSCMEHVDAHVLAAWPVGRDAVRVLLDRVSLPVLSEMHAAAVASNDAQRIATLALAIRQRKRSCDEDPALRLGVQ
jgi:hypothetical protein